MWGCFTKYNLGPLVKLDGKVMAVVYIDILKNYLLPFLDDLDDQENYLFQEEWLNIDIDKYQNLVNSMPRRVAAVIKSKGHPTKY